MADYVIINTQFPVCSKLELDTVMSVNTALVKILIGTGG